MTDVAIDDAVLERLIEQFASPYDCLRELVQNGMDAGSTRIAVELRIHGEPGAQDVAFELCVVDDGCGMTEAVIEAELARLFASSKRDDRTKAGGFGVGFVSVFAWRPDAVLLQTGRHGEAWELEFDRTARFAMQRLEVPVEGTTVRLIRRGRRDEHATIRAAARASLWRWCRFCPVEIEFSDVESGEHTVIRDVEVDAEAELTASHVSPDTHVRVAFAVPPRAVLLRHGLVLAEGDPSTLLPRVFADAPASAQHVQIWADSPSLSTDIGRDHVVDDAGRRIIERRAVDLLERARGDLLAELVRVTAAPQWTPEVAARHAHLHAHLAHERAAIGRAARKAPIVRLAGGAGISVSELVDMARSSVVEILDDAASTMPPSGTIPRAVSFVDARGDWLRSWLREDDVFVVGAGALVRDVTPWPRVAGDLPELVADVLRDAGLVRDVNVGAFSGTPTRPWAAQLEGTTAAAPRVLLSPAKPGHRPIVWLDRNHPICIAVADGRRTAIEAVAALVFGIAHWLGGDFITTQRTLDFKRAALLGGTSS